METVRFILDLVIALGTIGAAVFAGWAALVAARTAKTAEVQSQAALAALELQRDVERGRAAEQARRVRCVTVLLPNGEWRVFVRNNSNERISP